MSHPEQPQIDHNPLADIQMPLVDYDQIYRVGGTYAVEALPTIEEMFRVPTPTMEKGERVRSPQASYLRRLVGRLVLLAVTATATNYVNRSGGLVDQFMASRDDTPVAERVLDAAEFKAIYGADVKPDSFYTGRCLSYLKANNPEAYTAWTTKQDTLKNGFDTGLTRVATTYTLWDEKGKSALMPLREAFKTQFASELMPGTNVEAHKTALHQATTTTDKLRAITDFMSFYNVKVTVDNAAKELPSKDFTAIGDVLIDEYAHLPKGLFTNSRYTELKLTSVIDQKTDDGEQAAGTAQPTCGEPQYVTLGVKSITEEPGPDFLDTLNPVANPILRFLSGDRGKYIVADHELSHLVDPQMYRNPIFSPASTDMLTQMFSIRLLHNPKDITNYASTNNTERYAEHMGKVLYGNLVRPDETRLMRSDMAKQTMAALATLEISYPGITAYLATR
jgi:hypothetical protein